MGGLVWTCMFLVLHRADSYVLLTANVDDVHAIINQVASSNVATHLKDIWNRATESFRKHYTDGQPLARSRDDDEDWHRDGKKRQEDGNYRERSGILKTERRKAVSQFMELGRNASLYLKSMKDMFDRL